VSAFIIGGEAKTKRALHQGVLALVALGALFAV